MAKQTTTQKSHERETEQTQQLNTHFQALKELPISLRDSQCVLHKHELIICGGLGQRACYSYHTLKNEYKFICAYPSHVKLWGHCAVKLVDNNNKHRNQITLLSFGGFNKHTLVMKYVSIWGDDNNSNNENKNENVMNESRELNESNQTNQTITINGFLSRTIAIIRLSLEGMMTIIEECVQ
ncbi:hypothetical protein RFI_02398 [Reticulomyxa filosa]|uniref:Uncharacterized protein n=1 Tax=Reticulomyxa filosa TaxID=46433 RepID=X6PAM0_RETFI|nr:hypothetical protein RFI_02398 [Reticulomyxa filosa]|eukprot:ETO34692.1 hypothetical protein RFI_02398 [Reticulomyxa filosa]